MALDLQNKEGVHGQLTLLCSNQAKPTEISPFWGSIIIFEIF